MRVVSVYAPNDSHERKIFLGNLQGFVDTPVMLVVAEEFNCVLRAKDKRSSYISSNSGAKELGKMVHDNDLCDVVVRWDGGTCAFMHWQGRTHARLDRISNEIYHHAANCIVKPVAFSDHTFVVCDLVRRDKPKSFERSPYWKLKDSVWDDQAFSEEVAERLKSLLRKDVDACGWEIFKQDLRLAAVAHCEQNSLEEKNTKRNLLHLLITLTREEERNPGAWTENIMTCKKRMISILERRYRCAMIRSRAEDIEQDEDPTKIFLSLERKAARRKKINQISHGGSVLKTEVIVTAFTDYYSSLFSERPLQNQCLSDRFHSNLPQISSQSNKAHGPDGVGAAFYKKYRDLLCPILMKGEVERIRTEAQAKQREESARLERERNTLEARITELRNFERDYRTQLRGYIEGQLRDLDEKSASTDSTPVSAIGL